MANGGTLAAARERKNQCLAESKANSTTVPTRSSSPASTQSTLAAHSLHSIESQTAISLSSDDDLPSSISLPAARSNSKRKLDSAAEVRASSEGPRQKPGPKPRPKVVPKKGKPVKTIVLMVPEATSEGSQRLAIQATISFEDALELIHETIGCVSVVQKPTANQNPQQPIFALSTTGMVLVTDAIIEEGSRRAAESAGTSFTAPRCDRTRCNYIQPYDTVSINGTSGEPIDDRLPSTKQRENAGTFYIQPYDTVSTNGTSGEPIDIALKRHISLKT
ncbi:hypothetical protein B0H14DRAFT_2597008 [Mycena olivaceomarginata]|nr:hypothetical protein B0H14DRAFT_2597008 [Mycena olivaceomarginata]